MKGLSSREKGIEEGGDGMLLMVLRNDKSPRVQKYRLPYVRVSQGEKSSASLSTF